MRLIDADVLKEKFLDMGCLDDKPCYGSEILDRMPTVCDIEQIRAEIEENINYNKKMNYQGIVAGLLLTLNIIDKYIVAKKGGAKNEY